MTRVDNNLNVMQKELVAVGASVGAGCHPCVDHHLRAGAEAGLDGGQLLAAVTSAERVASEAAVQMGDHVRGQLGTSMAEPALLSRLEEALASLGAALGANDARNIERQLRAALDSGAARPQLEQAIETAGTVQQNATRIHLRKAERALDALAAPVTTPEQEAGPDDSCGCGTDDSGEASASDPQPTDPVREMPTPVACAGDGDTTSRANDPAAGCSDATAARFAAAMAECHHMFARAGGTPATPAEIVDAPAATVAAGTCGNERA